MIEKPILEVLESASCSGNLLYLNAPTLDRTTYMRVNKVLDAMGGKWKGGKTKAHVFDTDPSALLEEVLATGVMPEKNPFSFFETPPTLALRMFEEVRGSLDPYDRVLEPSAGTGAILDVISDQDLDLVIDAIEIAVHRCKVLQEKGYPAVCRDFLLHPAEPQYAAVLMNPPFRVAGDSFAYITHIEHAMQMVAPGGRLVAIAPAGFAFRNAARVRDFRAKVESMGGWEALPSGTFLPATGVETVLLWMDF